MDKFSAKVRNEAADWIVRMHEPNSERHARDLAAWRAASVDNDAAYRQQKQQAERTRFGASLDIVKDRNLDRVAAWHRRPAARFAVAAVFIIVIFAAVLAFPYRPLGSTSQAYRNDPGDLRSFVLADGTRVILDADSAIRFSFSSSVRRADLVRGRARFDIAANTALPFVASAGGAAISTQGSAFDLDLAPHGVHVAVLRGRAEVRGPRGGTGQAATFWRLSAGQDLSIAPGSVPGAASPDAFQWPNGMLSFDGERLDDAIALFNRYNRQHLRLSDDANGARRITGAFQARDPGGFAVAIAAMFGMSVSTDRNGTLALNSGQEKNIP